VRLAHVSFPVQAQAHQPAGGRVRNGGILSTFDPETGKLLREERLKEALGEYYASPVAGDGKVYFINKEGKATTIKAGASWQVLSSADFAEQAIATPAIVDGSMYVRTEETLYSFGSESTLAPQGIETVASLQRPTVKEELHG